MLRYARNALLAGSGISALAVGMLYVFFLSTASTRCGGGGGGFLEWLANWYCVGRYINCHFFNNTAECDPFCEQVVLGTGCLPNCWKGKAVRESCFPPPCNCRWEFDLLSVTCGYHYDIGGNKKACSTNCFLGRNGLLIGEDVLPPDEIPPNPIYS